MAEKRDILSKIKVFISKYTAKVVSPWDGTSAILQVGPTRVAISGTKKATQSANVLVRIKHLDSVLERDVFDLPSLREAGLIEDLTVRTAPAGTFRPRGGVPKIIYPTGIISVDRALVSGGFIGKRVSRIMGPSQSTKSLILYMAMITCWALYRKPSLLIAPEFDFDEDRFLTLPGADSLLGADALDIYEPGSGEDAYDEAIDKIRDGDYGIVGFDSLTSLVPRAEHEKSHGDPSKVGQKAMGQTRFMEKVLPVLHHQTDTALIVIVQMRKKISTTHGPTGSFDEVSGGYIGRDGVKAASGAAVEYYINGHSLRLFPPTKVKYSEEDGRKIMVAHMATGFVDKSKLGPKGKRFEFLVDYYHGIELIAPMVEYAVRTGVIETHRHGLTIPNLGLSYKSAKALRAALQGDADLYRKLYQFVIGAGR